MYRKRFRIKSNAQSKSGRKLSGLYACRKLNAYSDPESLLVKMQTPFENSTSFEN